MGVKSNSFDEANCPKRRLAGQMGKSGSVLPIYVRGLEFKNAQHCSKVVSKPLEVNISL